MKYKVVVTEDLLNFQSSVNERLAEGWQLQGGVSIAASYNATVNPPKLWLRFAQAMVKDTDDDDE